MSKIEEENERNNVWEKDSASLLSDSYHILKDVVPFYVQVRDSDPEYKIQTLQSVVFSVKI